MRTFRFRSAGVAVALIAGSAVGAQIAGVKPAVAQVPAFVITPTQEKFDIKPGEKVTLGKIFNIQQAVPGAQITVILAAATPGVEINGVPGNGQYNVPFSNLNGLLAATVTATSNGAIGYGGLGFRIIARNSPVDPTESISSGLAAVRYVEPPGVPTPALAVVPLASPPSINVGEKVPLGRFLTTNLFFGPPQITSITFQASGGAQLNGLSRGAVPPLLEALATASVTASSDGGITIFIDYLVAPIGQTIPLAYQTQGSILVRFVAPTTPTPTPPATPATVAPTPATVAPTPATVAPTPASSGPPPVGGGNRAPVAKSMQLIATTGAATPLALQASDADANALTFVLVQLPAHGKLSGQAPNLSYTPDGGFLGTDALIFTATDGTASSAQATVTITVTGKAASSAKTVRKVVKKVAKKVVKTTKKR